MNLQWTHGLEYNFLGSFFLTQEGVPLLDTTHAALLRAEPNNEAVSEFALL